VLAKSVAYEALHKLVHGRSDRHWPLVLPRRRQAKVEVLAQQRRGKGRVEVEVDEGRRLVPAERRAHDAVVEAGQQRLPANAALLGEYGHLGERLGDHAEKEVVAELDGPRQLAVPYISRSPAAQAQVMTGPLARAPRAP